MSKPRPSKDITPSNLDFEGIKLNVKEAGGFYRETEHHVITYTPGKSRLLVSFDNLASLKSKHPGNHGDRMSPRRTDGGHLG